MAKVKVNINMAALNKVKEGLNKGGGDLFVGHKHLKPNLYIRLMPGHPNIADIGSFTEEGYWINSKRYVSPKTFGKPCPIAEEVEEARALNDSDIDKLLKSRNFSEKSVISFPVAVLTVEDEKKFKFSGIQQDMIKVFQCGPQLGNEIIGIIINPAGCEYEELYDEDGYVIQCNKEGTGLETKYSAQMIVKKFEVPEEFYDYDKIPDIYEMTRKKVKSDDYLRGVIRNYLYGEPMPEEEAAPKGKPAASAKLKPKATVKPKAKTKEVVEEEEDRGKKKKRRSLMDDLRGN